MNATGTVVALTPSCALADGSSSLNLTVQGFPYDSGAPLTCRYPPASVSDSLRVAVSTYDALLALAQGTDATARAELANLKYLTALTALNNVSAWAAVADAQNTRTVGGAGGEGGSARPE